MKIISWNCNGALRKKTEFIDSYSADILVIQECEDPSQSTKAHRSWAGEYQWNGDNKNKGIGIFARNRYKIERLNWQKSYTQKGISNLSSAKTWNSRNLKLFLPCRVNKHYTLLGVWTKKNNSEYFGYIGQFWKYLQIHREDISKGKTIVCGDFNSNVIWDKPDSWWNHSDVVRELAELNLLSVYHRFFKEEQGNETRPTLYHQRNPDKPYHVDYAFASNDLFDESRNKVEVGKYRDWIKLSDHMPIVFTLDI